MNDYFMILILRAVTFLCIIVHFFRFGKVLVSIRHKMTKTTRNKSNAVLFSICTFSFYDAYDEKLFFIKYSFSKNLELSKITNQEEI